MASQARGMGLVARAKNDMFVRLGEGPDEHGVEIDPRDQGLVQNLISFATMGAKDMNIGLGLSIPGERHIKHHHPYGSEFYYIISGRMMVHVDGEDFEAEPGSAIYIPPNCVHGTYNHTDKSCEMLYGLSRGDYSEMGLVYDE